MWTEGQEKWLQDNYSLVGQSACAKFLNKSIPSIRMKTYRLHLKQNRQSDFFKDWQQRAAKSKIGKKRPAQAIIIKKLHTDGKLIKTKEQCKAVSIRAKAWIKVNGHPKGALGMKHSEDTKKILSEKSKAAWTNPNYKLNSQEYKQIQSDRMSLMQTLNKLRKGYSRGHQGKRKDLNDLYVRSAWEANYARYLNWLIEGQYIYKWEYEADTFYFESIKRGTRSYTPDFKIWETKDSIPYYVEVKGWMDQKSQTKLNRMAKFYPHIKITLFQQKDYKELKDKISPLLINWE